MSPADVAATPCCQRLKLSNPTPLSELGYTNHPACQLHELPKYQPLPAVGSDCWAARSTTPCQQIAKETASVDSFDSGFVTSNSPALSDKHKPVEELDAILQLFDRSVVLVWLQQTKRSITDIADWYAEGENFIRFSHFWLLEFSSDRRCSMFELEYGLLRDKIAAGCRSKQPSSEQLVSLMSTVLHEFPKGKLTGLADACTFLENLEALAEKGKRDSLLAAVSYSLCNQQHYDCLLAVRTYAIVTVWSAILDQYRSGMDSGMANQTKKSTPRPSTARGRSKRSSQSAWSARPSTASSKSRSELKFSGNEAAANADVSNQKRLFDAIRFILFCSYVIRCSCALAVCRYMILQSVGLRCYSVQFPVSCQTYLFIN